MKSTSKLLPFPTAPKPRNHEELEFLPAALEIVETPPSPLGRAIGATILAMLVLGLAWSAFGRVDIVATATGKVIPTGRSKIIQPFETGVLRSIRVSEGEFVKSGQTLIELDPTINDGEINHLQSDLQSAQLDTARLRAALADTDDPLGAFHPPATASPDRVAMQRQFLIAQVSEHRAKIASLDGQKAQKEAALASISATISKLDAIIPTIEERVNIRKNLNEFGSRLQYFEVLQQLTESQQERLVQKSHVAEMQAAITTILETRSQTKAEYRRILLAELAEAERKAAGFTADLSKAEQRAKLQSLTAPVSGTVQQLAVHTIGGVVTPAQALMVIVPVDSSLEIEASVNNRDIGFIHTGDEVAIKVDTFDFTRYGLLHGRVLSISSDSVTRDVSGEKTADKQATGSMNTTSEPKGQEMTYVARISVPDPHLQIDDRIVSLSPGMAITAEIKTGSRRIIGYLLSPLMKYRQESLRER
ncbi:HlyD family type I secretion periplasmic adaptor subunit [Bradyrhizobium symbiodeficiens]|uniref:Membrane fusion protein (MFP) family protein n=1 Tax=Bradyrhizobium symbiodeficiens TaxID=1404367 RepID=A0ABX5VZF5_9BRAD|nr:HlyD family type I secretion periplasmic adaptor subunit [Bradyrhizobium symbiodeficiens]AWM10957.1 HlyD family type I secretion periplasmic adaptor subunit [Bradyrhizobium symbiodeficiens]QDF36265.1 HlyD family type I secretion periplasmic adaptor subunit [Bradyrhizobium symbiodeficiens]